MSAPIRAVLVDDEPLVRRGLRDFLQDEPDVQVVGEAGDGLAALETLERERPDLLFLDVQMPALDGFDVLARADLERLPVVVFVTAFEQYALRAFEVHAADYLLKPFDRQRFAAALARARAWLQRADGDAGLRRLVDDVRRERRLERLPVRAGERIRLVDVADVEWFEARGNYVAVHHREGGFLMRETLAHLEASLDPRRFVRAHRSSLVQLAAVVELRRLPGGDFGVRLRSGAEVVLSRTHRAGFEQALGRPLG